MKPAPCPSLLKQLLCALGFMTGLGTAAEFRATERSSFEKAAKSAKPGDTIVLKNGKWSDTRLRIEERGTAEKPITIKAETPGKVIFTGDSRISLGGEHLVVDGLWFQNPTGLESIELRTDSKRLATHCRITNCAVINDQPDSGMKDSSRFISIHGKNHRVDHCYFAGKTTEGPTMVVWLTDQPNVAHRIDHNHFGPRQRLGRNGGETIRVGDSKTSMLTAACVVEHNLFEKCDGEAECISNKSCGNLYRRNHFVEVSGTLTLRHGNDCRVEDNVFLGRGAKGSGGVRIIGERHLVTGNRFEDLTGTNERSALCFMQGIPNSPANGYFQVKKAKVTNNLFLNCKRNFLLGMKGDSKATLPPIDSVISGNQIQTNRGEAFEILCDVSGVSMEDNSLNESAPSSLPEVIPLDPTGPTWMRNQ